MSTTDATKPDVPWVIRHMPKALVASAAYSTYAVIDTGIFLHYVNAALGFGLAMLIFRFNQAAALSRRSSRPVPNPSARPELESETRFERVGVWILAVGAALFTVFAAYTGDPDLMGMVLLPFVFLGGFYLAASVNEKNDVR